MADKKEKLTVGEFKMWLEGVEEMQDSEWTPTAAQWKRIRDKIRMLDSTSTPPAPTSVFQETVVAGPPGRPGGMLPMVQSGNPLEAMNINPADFAVPATPPAGRPFLNDDPSRPAKTPNIDTSGGKPYSSTFT